MTEAVAHVTLADFLEGEERGERRHELVGGRVYLQAGGPERHDVVVTGYGDLDVDGFYDALDAIVTTT